MIVCVISGHEAGHVTPGHIAADVADRQLSADVIQDLDLRRRTVDPDPDLTQIELEPFADWLTCIMPSSFYQRSKAEACIIAMPRCTRKYHKTSMQKNSPVK